MTTCPPRPLPTRMSIMTTLTEPTLGLLVQITVDARSRDELATLLLRADLEQDRYLGYDSGGDPAG